MSKRIFIGLLVMCLIVLAGGCGGSISSLTGTANINTLLRGVWTSSANGTAVVTNTNIDSEDIVLEDLPADIQGKIPSELREQYSELLKRYEEVKQQFQDIQKDKPAATVSVPVARTVLFFDDCNVEESSGTTKLTGVVILSGDSICLPIFYNGTAISTQRNSTNTWTATTPDGDTLSISMTSDEQINLSGKVHYLDYDCEFSTVIEKNAPNSINPQAILDGTWSLNEQGGGYLAVASEITSAVIPKTVSISFKDTQQAAGAITTNVTSFYSLYMMTANTESNEDASILQTINPATEGTLTQIYGNVYKFAKENSEGIIFVENVDEILMFMAENGSNTWKTCMFVPLKKVSFDLEEAMSKTWTAFDGGGYSGSDSFTLGRAALDFSGATADDADTITATVNINASFFETNYITGASVRSHEYTSTVAMKLSGNFLSFEYGNKAAYDLVFISDTEAFLSISDENKGEYFVLRLRAEN